MDKQHYGHCSQCNAYTLLYTYHVPVTVAHITRIFDVALCDYCASIRADEWDRQQAAAAQEGE